MRTFIVCIFFTENVSRTEVVKADFMENKDGDLVFYIFIDNQESSYLVAYFKRWEYFIEER
jgi:hypothetical protein